MLVFPPCAASMKGFCQLGADGRVEQLAVALKLSVVCLSSSKIDEMREYYSICVHIGFASQGYKFAKPVYVL